MRPFHPQAVHNDVRVLMCWTQDGTPRKIKIINKRPGRKVSATVVDAEGNSSVKTSTVSKVNFRAGSTSQNKPLLMKSESECSLDTHMSASIAWPARQPKWSSSH